MKAKEHISQSVSLFSGSETLTEQERTECINTLDDLCAVLEQISASLTKNSSEITSIYERANYLLNTGANILEHKNTY
jgi:hypothetical protein